LPAADEAGGTAPRGGSLLLQLSMTVPRRLPTERAWTEKPQSATPRPIMALALYNSLTRRKEAFQPIDPRDVRMYVCGPTVYDYAHIGNARAVVVFDLLYRVLRHEYGEAHVKYVRNITDVDDKIIDAARANGEPIEALTARTAQIFHEDMAALGNLPPDVEPRATAHIPQMIAMIERLIAAGHAYAAEGHVLFAVASWPAYGKLARRSRKEMIAGARVEIAPYKRDPGDFVLWKPSSPDQPGWDSPWGRGRPGWHIECSAMSETHLGEHFDIHGGGVDLIFPHHENEVAQSEAAHGGEPFVNFWVHNGFLSVDSTKMSKSLGNFVTAHEVLRNRAGEVVRLALLRTHYRDPLNWTRDRLEQASQDLFRFYVALNRGQHPVRAEPTLAPTQVLEALEDDLNAPLALAHLHQLIRDIHGAHERGQVEARDQLQAALASGGQLLGLLATNPEAFLKGAQASDNVQLEQRIADRALALHENRSSDAERIRDELAAGGVTLEDHPDGTTTWRRFVSSSYSMPSATLHHVAVTEQMDAQDRVDATVSNSRIDAPVIDALVAERTLARKERRFADADRIRDELAAEGVLLEDGPSGTTWRRG
jgi:cysteinyl-tRNA synthetase